ncbi:hypothetical protein EDB89DRAFT_2102237 [Lactarius sanguifluus]|nr:hypothetical protein EDB89DRAFT_2102237 [Lactarius sanguifluus]
MSYSAVLIGIINSRYTLNCRLSGGEKRAVSFIPGFPLSPPQVTYPMCGDESARSLKTTSPQQGTVTGYGKRLLSSFSHHYTPHSEAIFRTSLDTIFDTTFFCFFLSIFLELGLHTGAVLG